MAAVGPDVPTDKVMKLMRRYERGMTKEYEKLEQVGPSCAPSPSPPLPLTPPPRSQCVQCRVP